MEHGSRQRDRPDHAEFRQWSQREQAEHSAPQRRCEGDEVGGPVTSTGGRVDTQAVNADLPSAGQAGAECLEQDRQAQAHAEERRRAKGPTEPLQADEGAQDGRQGELQAPRRRGALALGQGLDGLDHQRAGAPGSGHHW
ncbi:MAG TPA: hypothetical protein QGF58_05370 [Myxococcota bacterium]|nr:hypothetical protein [Myxococcota bacterium]